MLLGARTVADSIGSLTSGSKARSSRLTARWSMRITFVSVVQSERCNRSRVRWAIAARRRKYPRRLSVCYGNIGLHANRAKICGAISRGTATKNFDNFWLDSSLSPWNGIYLRLRRLTRWRAKGMNTAALFPMFLKLEGRNCLVLGAGSVGEQKIRSLLDCGARIRVVAPP